MSAGQTSKIQRVRAARVIHSFVRVGKMKDEDLGLVLIGGRQGFASAFLLTAPPPEIK